MARHRYSSYRHRRNRYRRRIYLGITLAVVVLVIILVRACSDKDQVQAGSGQNTDIRQIDETVPVTESAVALNTKGSAEAATEGQARFESPFAWSHEVPPN